MELFVSPAGFSMTGVCKKKSEGYSMMNAIENEVSFPVTFSQDRA